MDHPLTTLVIPCYNEQHRFRAESFAEGLRAEPGLRLLFVNDGSSDDTLPVLERFCAHHTDRAEVLNLQPNGGKGEAVRRGLLQVLAQGNATYVGFWDADLATPLDALPRYLAVLNGDPAMEMVFGARVRLLGRHVARNPMRHYAGRIFATAVSVSLGVPVYDTQCGAKLFRATPRLQVVLATQFCSRWIFDVELLARFLVAWQREQLTYQGRIYELPLHTWVDVAGSKVQPGDFVKSFTDLVKIRREFRRGRSDV